MKFLPIQRITKMKQTSQCWQKNYTTYKKLIALSEDFLQISLCYPRMQIRVNNKPYNFKGQLTEENHTSLFCLQCLQS